MGAILLACPGLQIIGLHRVPTCFRLALSDIDSYSGADENSSFWRI